MTYPSFLAKISFAYKYLIENNSVPHAQFVYDEKAGYQGELDRILDEDYECSELQPLEGKVESLA